MDGEFLNKLYIIVFIKTKKHFFVCNFSFYQIDNCEIYQNTFCFSFVNTQSFIFQISHVSNLSYFILLSIITFRYIYVANGELCSFLCLFYCIHIHLFLSICLLVLLLVFLSCFCILTIVNNANNIGLHVSFQVNFFPPDI